MNPFHYAFRVKDLESTIAFYHDILGCRLGDSAETWLDFDFFGHQLSAHVSTHIPPLDYSGKVDGVSVPMPHFGCIIGPEDFTRIKQSLQTAGVQFIIKPQTRYPGKKGEQQTMFVLDYSGNPIEFKSFTNPDEIFNR